LRVHLIFVIVQLWYEDHFEFFLFWSRSRKESRDWSSIDLVKYISRFKSSFHFFICTEKLDWSSSQVFIPTFWLAQVHDITVVIQLEYSISISWLDLISISSRVRIQVLDSIRQAIKNDIKYQDLLFLNLLRHYTWKIYVQQRKLFLVFSLSSSCCLHYLVALSIEYISRCLILIRHMNYQDLRSRKNLISRSFIHLLSVVFILMTSQVKIHETLIRFSLKRNKLFKKQWIKFIAILLF